MYLAQVIINFPCRILSLPIKNLVYFYHAEKIQQQMEVMANQMNTDLKAHDVIFIGVLNGAFMFAADLLKRIQLNVQISFMKVSSYRGTYKRPEC